MEMDEAPLLVEDVILLIVKEIDKIEDVCNFMATCSTMHDVWQDRHNDIIKIMDETVKLLLFEREEVTPEDDVDQATGVWRPIFNITFTHVPNRHKRQKTYLGKQELLQMDSLYNAYARSRLVLRKTHIQLDNGILDSLDRMWTTGGYYGHPRVNGEVEEFIQVKSSLAGLTLSLSRLGVDLPTPAANEVSIIMHMLTVLCQDVIQRDALFLIYCTSEIQQGYDNKTLILDLLLEQILNDNDQQGWERLHCYLLIFFSDYWYIIAVQGSRIPKPSSAMLWQNLLLRITLRRDMTWFIGDIQSRLQTMIYTNLPETLDATNTAILLCELNLLDSEDDQKWIRTLVERKVIMVNNIVDLYHSYVSMIKSGSEPNTCLSSIFEHLISPEARSDQALKLLLYFKDIGNIVMSTLTPQLYYIGSSIYKGVTSRENYMQARIRNGTIVQDGIHSLGVRFEVDSLQTLFSYLDLETLFTFVDHSIGFLNSQYSPEDAYVGSSCVFWISMLMYHPILSDIFEISTKAKLLTRAVATLLPDQDTVLDGTSDDNMQVLPDGNVTGFKWIAALFRCFLWSPYSTNQDIEWPSRQCRKALARIKQFAIQEQQNDIVYGLEHKE
jgi:hypothetical protein